MTFLKKRSFPVCILIGTGAALLFTVLLLLPVAMAVNRGALGQGASAAYALATAAIGVFAATILVARTRDSLLVPTGALIGAAYGTLAALVCALSGALCAFGAWTVWLYAVTLCGGVFGAFSAGGKKNKRRKRR